MNRGEKAMTLFIKTSVSLYAFAVFLSVAWSSELTKDSLDAIQKNIADKKAVLVDVREKSEWEKGHIEGATFLPLSKLQEKVDPVALAKVLPKEKIIYTHCVAGIRSVKAGNILEKLGYEVRPLKPGYKELVEAGFKNNSFQRKK
jgi:rhodanese-related sulfurtransferase